MLDDYKDKLISDGLAPRTVDTNISYLKYFFNWYGKDNVRMVTRKDVQDYKIYLLQEHKSRFWNKRLSNSSIANRLYALKGYFKYLEDKKIIFSDPTKNLTAPKVKKFSNTHVLTQKEVTDLIQKTDETLLGKRDKLIFELFYSTALRSNELCGLKLSSIDMMKKLIFPERSKGGDDCPIPIIKSTYKTLDHYLEYVRPGILKFYKRKDIPELFITRRGTRMTVYNMNKLFEKYRGNKKHIHPHALRSSCATHMLTNGADIRNIQVLLGHHRLETTQGYTKLTLGDLRYIHEKFHPREKKARVKRS